MSASHRISDFMTKSPVVVDRNTTMAHALRIMDEQGFRHLPVTAGGNLVGVISERELKIVENMRGIDSAMCIVGDFIVGAPYTVTADAPLREVALDMASHKYGSAVVVEADKVIGLFTTTDALRALATILR